MAVSPLHFLTYRVDLPPRFDWLRGIPEFVAALLTKEPSAPHTALGDDPFALQRPKNLLWRAFGSNLTPADGQLANPDMDIVDESQPIDIESLLGVRVAELLQTPFPMTTAKGRLPGHEPLCPEQARYFREDLSLYLRAYGNGEIPVRALGDQILALLGLHLTTYSLSHVAASNHLYQSGEWLPDTGAYRDQWATEIYVDMTGGRHAGSRDLARASFVRHYGRLMDQIRTMLGFRLLAMHLEGASDIRAMRDLKSKTGIEFLTTLSTGRLASGGEAYQSVMSWARTELNRLRRAQPDEAWPQEIVAIAEDEALHPFDRLVEIVAVSDSELRGSMRKFLISVTRKNQASGLLTGSPRKDDDYYAMGPQLLEAIVHLVVLRREGVPSAAPTDISQLVSRLRSRYGIWIDQPPPSLDQSYEAHLAAQENLAAFKERLRELGLFRAVTDASRMQRLRPRYVPAGDRLEAPVL